SSLSQTTKSARLNLGSTCCDSCRFKLPLIEIKSLRGFRPASVPGPVPLSGLQLYRQKGRRQELNWASTRNLSARFSTLKNRPISWSCVKGNTKAAILCSIRRNRSVNDGDV